MQAFPGAYGWGANSIGGREGQIVEITNLNDSGSGSLRQALNQISVPRKVVFRVAGEIFLESNVSISHPFITIAGQTAPGNIVLRNHRLLIRTHDVIIRYLSWRGTGEPDESKAFLLFRSFDERGCHDVIVDHCSASWSMDDMIDIYFNSPGNPPIHNITIQNSLLAEPDIGHPTTMIVGSDHGSAEVHHISMLNNLMVLGGWRNPLHGGRHTETKNNVIYNWWNHAMGVRQDTETDIVNNDFRPGPSSDADAAVQRLSPGDPEIMSLYIAGNQSPGDGIFDPDADNWPMVNDHTTNYPQTDPVHQRLTPLSLPPHALPMLPAAEVWNKLKSHVGNSHGLNEDGSQTFRRDEFDTLKVLETDTGVGSDQGSPAAPGILPPLIPGTLYSDTDGDGMADEWEEMKGLDPNDPEDGQIVGPDGYSNVERFLNSQGGNSMEAIDNGDGTYTLTLTSGTEIGKATITGEVNGVPIVDIAEVDFMVGAADPATSEILAAPSSIPADGSSQSVVTVQLKDANGNPLTQGGDTVVLLTDLGFLG